MLTKKTFDKTIGKLFFMGTLPMLAVITFIVTILIIAAAFVYKETQSITVTERAIQNLATTQQAKIHSKFLEKEGIGSASIVALTNSSLVRSALSENDSEKLDIEFNGLKAYFAENSKLKNIKVEFYNKEGNSIYRSYGNERKQFRETAGRGYIKKTLLTKEPGFFYVMTANGLQLKSVVPIFEKKKLIGLVEISQGIGSVVKDLEKNGEHKYAIAVSKEYLEKYPPRSVLEGNSNNVVLGNSPAFLACGSENTTCRVGQEKIDIVKGLDIAQLIKEGGLRSDGYFYTSLPVYDVKERMIGTHILTTSSKNFDEYLSHQLAVVDSTFYGVVITAILTSISMLFLIWLLIVTRIEKMKDEIADSADTSDLFKRVSVYGNNELSRLGRAYNTQMTLVQQSNQEVLQVLSGLASGDLERRIESNYKADFNVMKNSVNQSIDNIKNTFLEIDSLLEELKNGEFNNIHQNNFSGYFHNIIESTKETMAELSSVFGAVEHVMALASRGNFDERVQVESKGKIQELISTVNNSMENLSVSFNDVVEAANRLADGDFTKQITNEYEFKIDEAKQSINKAVIDLRRIVSDVKQISSVVRSNSNSVAEGTDSLNTRTQEQAASLEETSASMEETSSQVTHNLEITEQAAFASKIQVEKIDESSVIMKEAQDLMDEIKTVSIEINSITEAIESIAFQTNLLALNAAVEAARAGEHGRGFAVVAGEVRSLSGKASESASSIKALIEKTSKAIDKGVSQVNKVGLSLIEVSEETHKVSQIIDSIQTSSNEQVIGIQQVNQAISAIDSVTQQNAALVEQTHATCEELISSADELTNAVSKLKV